MTLCLFFHLSVCLSVILSAYCFAVAFTQTYSFVETESPCVHRMPDPDFSVSDVKLFVGKRFPLCFWFLYFITYTRYSKSTRSVSSRLFCFELASSTPCSPRPSDRQSQDDRRDGREHSKGHGDVNESMEAVLRNSSLGKGKAVQRHQSGVQSYETGASRQETCLSRTFLSRMHARTHTSTKETVINPWRFALWV